MALRTSVNARAWHLLTFLVTVFAVLLQLLLVIQGNQHLGSETDPALNADQPGLAERLVRFFSYLTIWSNILVAGIAATLAVNPRRDGRVWRALRLNAVVIVFGGGIVHFFFLRPLLDLDGWDLVADRLLHVVVPILAVVGWVVFGPRRRIDQRDLVAFLVLPLSWLGYTLIRGAIVRWYPYPFIDVDQRGYASVAAACLAISVLMLALAWLVWRLDQRLPELGATTERRGARS